MSAYVVLLRVIAVLAFAAPMLLRVSRRPERSEPQPGHEGVDRAPLAANFAAFVLFFASLLVFAGDAQADMALPLALSGCLLALAGATLVVRSRAELGSAWSLAPKAHESTGLVTTGPYRFVRHPIYLGLGLLAFGEGVAFGSWPACLIVFVGVVPTFIWRASAEETLLRRTFGERFEIYRRRTAMIIPRVL